MNTWKKPGEKWLLDLYCGAGGAAVGYHRAGFRIVGVDNKAQPNYPFHFVQADAIEFCRVFGHQFDVIHASPPCQKYSRSTAMFRNGKYSGEKNIQVREYPDLVELTRKELIATGRPWIIENVPGAPVRPDLKICGDMVRLPFIIRYRWFELSDLFVLQPAKPTIQRNCTVNGHKTSVFGSGAFRANPRHKMPVFKQETVRATWGLAMGIDWMTCLEMAESIPPAYTEFIGREIFHQIKIEL